MDHNKVRAGVISAYTIRLLEEYYTVVRILAVKEDPRSWWPVAQGGDRPGLLGEWISACLNIPS